MYEFYISVFFVPHSYDEVAGRMDSGYPRSIENDFPGISDKFDAAVYQNGMEPYFSVILCGESYVFLCSLISNCDPTLAPLRLFVLLPW